VLVADDDPGVLRAVALALEVEGHEVATAPDGAEALTLLAGFDADVLVLDWMMPGLDGLAVCRLLRGSGDTTPVLMLSAREQVADRVDGLDAGADDYLAKPFDLAELAARLRALGRRIPADDALHFADLSLDVERRTGLRGQREITFTRTETALLALFLQHPGQVLTREVIQARIWGDAVGGLSNAPAVYLGYLRRKLEADGETRLIHTVRRIGYRLAEE
jgi:two-component system, OmpR family, response regulator MprA